MQWDYFKAHPERGRSFNTFQEGQRQGRGAHWLDVYPAQERLGDDDGFATAHEADEPEAVLLVDVGGGRGHDLRDFRGWTRENGVLGRRLVLEDLPEVVADVDRAAISAEGIEAVGYDFFAPQPVKGSFFTFQIHWFLVVFFWGVFSKRVRGILAHSPALDLPRRQSVFFPFDFPQLG